MGTNQHVTPHGDGRWQVRGEGKFKPSAVVRTQKEAISIATQIAKNQKSELLVHGTNGQIRSRNSYGNDPYPPQG